MSQIKHGDTGFYISFDSDYSLSVQYGGGNYCDNLSQSFLLSGRSLPPSATVEVAIFNKAGDFTPLLNDDVAGYVSVDKLPYLMDLVRQGKIADFRDALQQD